MTLIRWPTALAPQALWSRGAGGVAVPWRWLTSHPRWADAALAVAVFGASVWGLLADDPERAALDARTLLLQGLGAAALVARRRHPFGAWAVVVLTGVALIVHSGRPEAALLPSVVALYTVGASAPWWTGVLTASVTAVAEVGAVAAVLGGVDDRARSLIAFCGAAVAVGVAVRSHRAAVEAVEARARQAEATREEEAVRRVTDERLRIARELHDVVGHHISVVNVQAGVARHFLDAEPEQARAALGLVREASRMVLSEMSSLLGLLRTGEEEAPTGPAPGLRQSGALVDSMRRAGLQVTVRASGRFYELPELADLTAYRVVQESLTNALRHGAGSADLLIDHQPGAVVVQVVNPRPAVAPYPADGQRAQVPGSGHGLVGMRERVASVAGRFSAGPGPDGAFVVRVEIPRTAAA